MNKVIIGDCIETMKKLKEDGVKIQTCVTSPPYYGLRDYGHPGQIGQEKTPQLYIKKMVEVFRYVRDLMHKDGTLWLNIGDSYAQSGGGGKTHGSTSQRKTRNSVLHQAKKGSTKPPVGLKNKDLIGIPWMLAFALREDGWYLRQDIIWQKPNAMPESVRDRCTKSHEYIFLLSKSQRYYYDRDAIREPCTEENIRDFLSRREMMNKSSGGGSYEEAWPDLSRSRDEYMPQDFMRNKRSVWSVPTVPFKGAHFATFPPELIEPCILAGSRCGDIVFDPFMGTGTTALVAEYLSRQWLGIEINPEYERFIKERTAQQFIVC